ncbi:MAG: tetratricopeptide repeat protein [Microcoleus sp. PH2017_10_PVI_O_A]|uniref:tetratricopeptide repeat protein n=1 Tax=Microcoleus sp. PH2017_10_PVI_O_A TaxID=2798821 RepID=UPI001D599F11|nr:tetratricopeptide repeat protein [Microcoleus sp. PH2017_10_PVI_O_A]MCC3405799.1 tetratricopeptide repeat protein [Microcoleus sp. PH2017_10_PVI_O_A]
MAIGITTLDFYSILIDRGYFKDLKSVCELGSQEVVVRNWEDFASRVPQVEPLVEGFDPSNRQTIAAKFFYEKLGFELYKCIDTDESPDALVFDLNKSFKETYGYSQQFDLVTNHGTSEHCFHQYQCFSNIHDLCKVGELMIHCLPFQGALNHGFYNYHASFFMWLAAANNYQLLSLVVTEANVTSLIPYSDYIVRSLVTCSQEHRLIFVAFQKLDDIEFRVPYDGQYLSNTVSPGAIVSEYRAYQKSSSDYINRGNQLVESGQIEEAIFEYQQAIITNIYAWNGYILMGVALQKLGQLDEAIDSYRKAILYHPKSAEANYRLGVALQQQGKLEEGMESCKRAIAPF